MALYFITGIAGSGKTTLARELEKRGLEVVDADVEMSYWANKNTGERTAASDHRQTTDPQFFDEHDWYIDQQKVKELAQHAKNRTIFLVGSVANERVVWDYFKEVFCLYVSDNLLTQRIKERTDKDFGKSSHELHHLLELNREVKAKYQALGAKCILSDQPVNVIADKILASTNGS